jgi:RNA polymerase sigma-70 factor, ECF subfamily
MQCLSFAEESVMSSPKSITRLVADRCSPDRRISDEAARRLWEKFSQRLLALVRGRLNGRIRARADEEDVVQSAFRSFCIRLERGDDLFEDRDDLWRLLVTVTLNKVRMVARFHRQQKRDVRRDQSADPRAGERSRAENLLDQVAATSRRPGSMIALADEMERQLNALEPELRQIARWKLAGFTNEEIAAPDKLDKTVRTVERKLERIRRAWRR